MESEVIGSLVSIVLSAVLLVAFVTGRYYLRKLVGPSMLFQLATAAEQIVQALEQAGLISGWSGEQKYRRAMVFLTDFCEQYGIPVDTELLKTLIEAAVYQLNVTAGKFSQ